MSSIQYDLLFSYHWECTPMALEMREILKRFPTFPLMMDNEAIWPTKSMLIRRAILSILFPHIFPILFIYLIYLTPLNLPTTYLHLGWFKRPVTYRLAYLWNEKETRSTGETLISHREKGQTPDSGRHEESASNSATTRASTKQIRYNAPFLHPFVWTGAKVVITRFWSGSLGSQLNVILEIGMEKNLSLK